MTNKTIYLLVWFTGLFSAGLWAQPNNEESGLPFEIPAGMEAVEGERSVHFTYLGLHFPELMDNLYFLNGRDPMPVFYVFMERGRGLPISDGLEELVLARRVVVEEEVVYRPLRRFPLNSEEKDFWVILFPQMREGRRVLDAMLLNDGQEAHPRDHVRVHNYTPYPMVGRINNQRFELDRRGDVVIPYDAENDTHVAFEAYVRVDGEWVRSYLTSRQVRPDRRMNFIALMRPNRNIREGQSLMLRTLIETFSAP